MQTESEKKSTQRQIGDVREVSCCIVGGGPAGMMLATLLAMKKVTVLLLEQHQNFDRDFRGDTVHPSTLEILDQLWLGQRASEETTWHAFIAQPSVWPNTRYDRGFQDSQQTLPVHRAHSAGGFSRLHPAKGIAILTFPHRDGRECGFTRGRRGPRGRCAIPRPPRHSARGSRDARRGSRREVLATGNKLLFYRWNRVGSKRGSGQDCCLSEMPRTSCRRLEASGSTTLYRMRSRPQTCSQRRSQRAR